MKYLRDVFTVARKPLVYIATTQAPINEIVSNKIILAYTTRLIGLRINIISIYRVGIKIPGYTLYDYETIPTS